MERFINNLWKHQQNNELCDFTLCTNNTLIECHKVVLSSASSYFSELLCNQEHNTNIIVVSPVPLQILHTVVAFMYNSEYVIDDENVIEVFKLSRTWNLDILAALCVSHINNNVTINNACSLYRYMLDNDDKNHRQVLNEFIREHFKSLFESNQLCELSVNNFIHIIEHDEINVENEDVVFSSAVQIIDQQTSLEDTNRCLELIRFPHMSADFLLEVVQTHPLMHEPPQDRYVRDALRYHINKTTKMIIQPCRIWKGSTYYLSNDLSVYQYVPNGTNGESKKMLCFKKLVGNGSSVVLHTLRKQLVIVGYPSVGNTKSISNGRALLLDVATTHALPDLPASVYSAGVAMSGNNVYVIGGRTIQGNYLSSVYCLSLGSDIWQDKASMPYTVQRPLVIRYRECIYVLGGLNNKDKSICCVSKYNIADDIWKQCSDMPFSCNRNHAGVVEHDGLIKVITPDACLTYAEDSDSWSVKRYKKIGDYVKVFLAKEQVHAAVSNFYNFERAHRVLRYDDQENVWITMKMINHGWSKKIMFILISVGCVLIAIFMKWI